MSEHEALRNGGEFWMVWLEPAEFDEAALWCIEHGVMLSRWMSREEAEEKWGVRSLPKPRDTSLGA